MKWYKNSAHVCRANISRHSHGIHLNKTRRTTYAAVIWILALMAVFSSDGSRAGVVSGDDFSANTETAAAVLQGWYNDSGLWTTTEWWNAANCVEAVENAIVVNNGQKYLDVLNKTFDLNSDEDFLNDFYDDEGWWALAWIRAYDLTGHARFLKMANVIFDDMAGGWNDHCGGGIWWKKNSRYVNAIANELFLAVAIRLHQRAPGDAGPGSRLDWAMREWAWFAKSGLINSDNMINDGLDRRCENNGRTTWSYNQGVILGGLADLYKSTGDSNYLNQAMGIADAAIRNLSSERNVLMDPCEDWDCHGGDVPQFKGIFIRNLAYLYDLTRKPDYAEFLFRNAHSVWFNDRDSANHLGLRWTGPFDQADAARHSSAMFAVSAVAEPSTRLLPFAMGADSKAFNHSVGSAIGTLAWVCNATDAPQSGFMLDGAYLASLPKGRHVAHFRIAVDRVRGSSTPLVHLDIRNSHSGAVLGEKDILWNNFAAPNKSSDFPLVFNNRVPGDPLEFRVRWNAASDAPSLTLLDVSVDGGLNWTAANLAHGVGRLDGLDSWEADPVRDRASGFLETGAEAAGLPAGDCLAQFELKVDNFNWNKSVVATISVVETDTDKTVTARNLTRDEFPNTLYQTFSLKFKAAKGRRYDFRVFWHYAPNAPRLTQRSIVVLSKKT
jgi:predicted alpha-1,6-mannanase (GH76 family)